VSAWNFSVSSVVCVSACTVLSLIVSTTWTSTSSLRNAIHSSWVCASCVLGSSACASTSATYSCNGSIWALRSYFCVYAVMSYACSLFISCIPLTHYGIGIVFWFFFISWIAPMILSSSSSHHWTCGSSSNLVQICTSLSNKLVAVITCYSISCSCAVSSFFLCSFTGGGVVGMICS